MLCFGRLLFSKYAQKYTQEEVIKYALLIFYGLIHCLSSTVTAAENEVTANTARKTYSVGVEDIDYFPFFTPKETSIPPGFMIDLLTLFKNHADIELEFVYLPISRFPDWYRADNIDFRVPDNPIWSIESDKLVLSDPILNMTTDLVTTPDKQDWPFDSFKRIGSLSGFEPSPIWEDRLNSNEVTFVYDSSTKLLVQMLKKGLIDGLDIDYAVAVHYGELLGYSEETFVRASKAPDLPFNYHISTKNYPDVISSFNLFLRERADEINTLKIRYRLFESKP